MRSKMKKPRIKVPGISLNVLFKTFVVFLILFGFTFYLVGFPSALSYFTYKGKSDLITFEIPELEPNQKEEIVFHVDDENDEIEEEEDPKDKKLENDDYGQDVVDEEYEEESKQDKNKDSKDPEETEEEGPNDEDSNCPAEEVEDETDENLEDDEFKDPPINEDSGSED